MEKIDSFSKEFRFLSNFHSVTITYEGRTYKSTEHAYQASKSIIGEEQDLFCANITAAESKKLGREITLRDDWEDVKIGIMLDLLRLKFAHPELREMLLWTGDFYLEEGNYWNDTFWGVCKGTGRNHLGKLLMQVRDEVANGSN